MTIDTSKETGYITLSSSLPTDQVLVLKETGYAAQSFYPIDQVMAMKAICYVVLKPAALIVVTPGTGKAQIIPINM